MSSVLAPPSASSEQIPRFRHGRFMAFLLLSPPCFRCE
ncbi:hypothetical protein NPIL_237511, partial [Nephila pilipes]